MAKLIYVVNVSLDGYIEDAHGGFEWTAPNDEVFTFITDLVRPVGTYLYGRRMYETMAVWETQPALAAQSELMADFANVWQAGQDRLLHDAASRLDRQHAARAPLRPRFGPRDEGVRRERFDRRRADPRGARVQRRAGR
jgi:hypothetical protein